MNTSPPAKRKTRKVFIAVGVIIPLVAIAIILAPVVDSGCDVGPDSNAKIFVKAEIDIPLFAYRQHVGHYPDTNEGLQALIAKPAHATGWKRPYITVSEVPLDPWKHPYQYSYPGTHNGTKKPDVWSVGPDGISGTADDIGNW